MNNFLYLRDKNAKILFNKWIKDNFLYSITEDSTDLISNLHTSRNEQQTRRKDNKIK